MPETTNVSWNSGIEHANLEGAICVRFREKKIVDMRQIEALSQELSTLSSANGSQMVLNLDGVEFLSSAALNKLVSLERKLRAREGKLALCSLTTTVRDVFSITRLTEVFSIHENETAALAALQ